MLHSFEKKKKEKRKRVTCYCQSDVRLEANYEDQLRDSCFSNPFDNVNKGRCSTTFKDVADLSICTSFRISQKRNYIVYKVYINTYTWNFEENTGQSKINKRMTKD